MVGVWVFGGSKVRICDLEYKLRCYLNRSLGFKGFYESERKGRNLDLGAM